MNVISREPFTSNVHPPSSFDKTLTFCLRTKSRVSNRSAHARPVDFVMFHLSESSEVFFFIFFERIKKARPTAQRLLFFAQLTQFKTRTSYANSRLVGTPLLHPIFRRYGAKGRTKLSSLISFIRLKRVFPLWTNTAHAIVRPRRLTRFAEWTEMRKNKNKNHISLRYTVLVYARR